MDQSLQINLLNMQLQTANKDLLEIRELVGANEEELIQDAVKRIVQENASLKACLYTS